MKEPMPRTQETETPEPANVKPQVAVAATPEREAEAEKIEVPQPEQARMAFFRAFVAAKSEFDPVTKSRPIYEEKNWKEILARGGTPHVRYYFADLSDVMNCTDPALTRHGLYHRIDTEKTDDGGLRLTVTMAHVDGHVEKGLYTLGPEELTPGEGAVTSKLTPIQNRGIVDTYARRYALQHFLGVAAEEDLDGRASRGPEQPAGDPKAAAIFGSGAAEASPEPQPTGDPKAAAVFAGAPRETPAPEPQPETRPEPDPEPEPVAAGPEAELAADKLRLTEMLADSLTEAGIEDTNDNILALLDAACTQVGVTREDLNDIGTVNSLIALQQVSPVDPAAMGLQAA